MEVCLALFPMMEWVVDFVSTVHDCALHCLHPQARESQQDGNVPTLECGPSEAQLASARTYASARASISQLAAQRVPHPSLLCQLTTPGKRR